MLAFFSITISDDGSISPSRGSLFNPPAELTDNYRVKSYTNSPTLGWTRGEFGYQTLVRSDPERGFLVIPGQFLTDKPRPDKIFSGYKPVFSSLDVERYLDSHISRNNRIREEAEIEMSALVHDLRQLSSSIYHSAEQADRARKEKNNHQLSQSIKTVIATQTMLKLRIDYLDYSKGHRSRFMNDEKIPIYRRIDKVTRCFRASAANRGINIVISGRSHSLATGPDILDLIPYALIDNAIKYSPHGDTIFVDIREENSNTVTLIKSIGPTFTSEESNQLFQSRFRGKNAIKYLETGTGIGLSVAKDVVQRFRGRISAHCGNEKMNIDGVSFSEVFFSFSLPSEDPQIRN